MSVDICAKRMEELTADIASLEDRIKLLQKQRLRDEQFKQYLRASSTEEEFSKIRTEKKEEEIMLRKKKQTKASWYKAKLHHPLVMKNVVHCLPFGPKKDEVDVVSKEVEELLM